MVRPLTPKNKCRIWPRSYQAVLRAALSATLIALIFFSCQQQKKLEVVCFGDSITYGALVDGHSWVWQLQREEGSSAVQPFHFINAGRSGRKTSDTSELPPVLKAHPAPQVFIFFLGVNDLKDGNDQMVAAAVQNMQWMIRRVKAQAPKAHILLLAPSDINTADMSQINKDKLYNEHTKSALVKLAGAYQRLAKQEHTDFLSLLPVVSEDAYADGLHPNQKGQQQLKSAIWKKIKSYAK